MAAAELPGTSLARRAAVLGRKVARAALDDLQGIPGERVTILLGTMAGSPLIRLAIDPEIDTCALVRAERLRRLEGRSWRHLPEREWAAEDREVIAAVAAILAKRYSRFLSRKLP